MGKTTTLRSIIGLTLPRMVPSIFRANKSIASPPYDIAHLGVGYIPDDLRIFPDSHVRREPGDRPACLQTFRVLDQTKG